MSKLKSLKNKLFIFVLALIVPFTMAGAVTSLNKAANAEDGEDSSYVSSHMQEITVTNKNFNSSSSTYSLSTSLTGWTGQIKDGKTTAGIINVGTSFSNYMSTYRLSLNPKASASDSKILMINSNTTYSSDYEENRQGYVSSSISLDSNSYYSFQVSFKSDVNYKSTNIYKEIGQTTYDITNIKIEEEKTDNDETDTDEKVDDSESKNYAKVTYQSKTYYILKTDLTADSVEEGSDQTYTATAGVKYYALSTEYVPIDNNAYGKGSIYLSGLKSKNENNKNNYKFEMITSSEWSTMYFFVATGNESETVTLDLWLGGENNLASTGVVFYDDVQVYRYSENLFWQNYANYYSNLSYNKYFYDKDGNIIDTQTNDCTKLIDDRSSIIDITPENANFDFEENSDPNKLNGWKFISNSGNAQILNTIVPESFKNTGYNFVGNNLSVDYNKDTKEIKKNLKSLVLYTNDTASSVGVQANKSIDIKAHGYYKIKVYTKVSSLKQGNAYVTLKENNSIYSKDFGLNESNYTLASKSSTGISTNSSNAFNNNYNIIEFYIKGGNLYDTQIDLQLWLGSDSEKAIGCVVFDDITVEQISYTEYSDNSEDGNVLTLGNTYDEASIKNGYFNEATESDNKFTYPLTPAEWTIENKGVNAVSGIINTYNKYYNEYQNKFNNGEDGYNWARFANPANVEDQIYSNNLFMFYNSTKTNQSLKSPTIELNSKSYYKVSFDYKVLNTVIDSNAYIKVEMYDELDNLLFSADKINSDGKWKTYEMFINTFEGTADSYIKISFGTTENKIQGIAYLDNFEITTIDQSIFDAKNQERENIIQSIFDMEATLSGNISTEEHENIQKSIDELNEQLNLTSVINMSNFYLNLPTNVYGSPLIGASNTAYTSSSNSSNPNDAPLGGIVKGKDLNIESNALMIHTPSIGSYSLTSNYYIEFSANTYYALTFKLKTSFVYQNENNDITKHSKYDEDKKYNYGVTFGLNKYDYATNLMYSATDEKEDEYKTYTLYFYTDETILSQLYFAFVSDDEITAGEAIIYDLHLYNSESNSDIISSDIYSEIQEAQEDKDYDINSSAKYVASLSESDSSDDTEGDNTETDENDNKKSSINFNWLLIPTLITALSIIIAVVGTVLKKIKIKKIEIKRKESYDRKGTVHRDALRLKAEQQRAAEIKNVEKDIEYYKNQLTQLETEHKAKVVEDRKINGSKVTKEIEREFKSYSAKHAKIQEKIDILNEKIDTIKSPEYLLSLERKIYTDQEKEKKIMKSESKKKYKEEKKSNKK